MKRIVVGVALAIVATLVAVSREPALAAPGDEITPGSIRVDATYEAIGVVWEVTGDQDLDSTMTLEFRQTGTTTWNEAAPAVRSYPSIIVNGDPLGLDRWAASAMFLTPGTTYELRLTITDPDGGDATQTTSGTTRTLAQPDAGGRV